MNCYSSSRIELDWFLKKQLKCQGISLATKACRELSAAAKSKKIYLIGFARTFPQELSLWEAPRQKYCFMRPIRQKAEKETEMEVKERGKKKIRD